MSKPWQEMKRLEKKAISIAKRRNELYAQIRKDNVVVQLNSFGGEIQNRREAFENIVLELNKVLTSRELPVHLVWEALPADAGDPFGETGLIIVEKLEGWEPSAPRPQR